MPMDAKVLYLVTAAILALLFGFYVYCAQTGPPIAKIFYFLSIGPGLASISLFIFGITMKTKPLHKPTSQTAN